MAELHTIEQDLDDDLRSVVEQGLAEIAAHLNRHRLFNEYYEARKESL